MERDVPATYFFPTRRCDLLFRDAGNLMEFDQYMFIGKLFDNSLFAVLRSQSQAHCFVRFCKLFQDNTLNAYNNARSPSGNPAGKQLSTMVGLKPDGGRHS